MVRWLYFKNIFFKVNVFSSDIGDSGAGYQNQNTLSFQCLNPLLSFVIPDQFLGYSIVCHIIFNPKALGWFFSFFKTQFIFKYL